jgi:hypothetical protein
MTQSKRRAYSCHRLVGARRCSSPKNSGQGRPRIQARPSRWRATGDTLRTHCVFAWLGSTHDGRQRSRAFHRLTRPARARLSAVGGWRDLRWRPPSCAITTTHETVRQAFRFCCSAWSSVLDGAGGLSSPEHLRVPVRGRIRLRESYDMAPMSALPSRQRFNLDTNARRSFRT